MSEDLAAILRALDDVHSEFEKASATIDPNYNGKSRAADQRIVLIRVYSEAVERIVRSYVTSKEQR